MSHVSIKIAIFNDKDEFFSSVLQKVRGDSPMPKTTSHSDSIYRINENAVMKVRTYSGGRQEIILERLDEDATHLQRRSMIAVAFPRRTSRDSDIKDILGVPQFSLGKKRTSFNIKDVDGLRVYVDQLENGKKYLEFQMDDKQRPSLDTARELKDYVISLGFDEQDFIHDSYEDMFLSVIFNEKSRFTPNFKAMSEDLKKEVFRAPKLRTKISHKIFSEGEKGDFALLITRGSVTIEKDKVTLVTGQLVGEFASLEQGVRVCDVIANKGMEGYIVKGRLLERLMSDVPANAQKYIDWRRYQARLI